jgi:Tol biopolymer transport system component
LLQVDSALHAYMTNSDGSNRTHLLESNSLIADLTACGPKDMVIVAILTEENQVQLWRLNGSSGEFRQLTSGKFDRYASCSPDGKFVVYESFLSTDSMPRILKVSTDGGKPVELFRGTIASPPAVSPDGSLAAYGKVDGQGAGAKAKIVVQKLEGGGLVQEMEMPSTSNFHWLGWTPDGRALIYVQNTTGNRENLYMQPLAGGAPVQLTHFDSEPALVASYAWSRDGRKLAITRARYNDTDVVMFSGFR